MKKRLIRIVSVCLSLIVFITSLNLSFLVKAEGTNPSVYINPSNTQAIYTYDGYYVVFNLNGSWTGGHNVGIQIYNTSSETIEDWTLESDYSNNINNIWNASVLENANGVTKLYHDTWNSVIYPNSCVEFGYSSNETFDSFPSYFGMLGSEMTETNNELYSIDYNVTDEWEDGYTGEITITNNSENVIRNWALDFSCNNENISVWNARLITHEGNRVSVGNMGFNADINTDESVSFGFIVYNKTNNDEFYDYNLYESTFVSSEPSRELESLGDIGEAYCKELRDEDVVFDEATGLQYVKNQILISAYMGTPREAVEEIVDEVGATIVGYIELTCDFQIEFSDNKTIDELQAIVEYINGFSFVSLASLNLASEVDTNYYSDDWFYKDKYYTFEQDIYTNTLANEEIIYAKKVKENDTEDEAIPQGDNWSLEAMYIPSAWDHITNSSTVKVGIIDNYFEDRTNIDGELIFDEIVNNPAFDPLDYSLNHGTHVAGIIGASHNNGEGISGVATDVQLYGYSYLNNSHFSNSMNYKVAYATFICNNVRIINVSLGYKDEAMIYVASLDDGSSECLDAQKYIEEEAKILEEFLLKLNNAGYDYLIVGSAGNSNGETYISTSNREEHPYGYEKSKNNSSPYRKIDAKYGFHLGAIESEKLKKRIIIVGSVGLDSSNQIKCMSYSNGGNRVDVFAPGQNILSTTPVNLNYSMIQDPDIITGYNVLNGTSMAAPHISGLAALMLQVNPGLNCTQIKRLICGDNNKRESTHDGFGIQHNIPNGEKCIIQALNSTGIYLTVKDYPQGTLSGLVKNTKGEIVPNVEICAIRNEQGDNIDLDLYSFNFASDEYGEFIDVLPYGTYDIVFSAENYLPGVIQNIVIEPDTIKTIQVELVKNKKSNSKGLIKGEIIDAITGSTIWDATIKIRKGWNNTSGSYVCNLNGEIISVNTSHSGEFELQAPIGNYTIEIQKEGYINVYCNVVSIGRQEDYTYTLALSSDLSDNEYRIVLTWNEPLGAFVPTLVYYDESEEKILVQWNEDATWYYNGVKAAELNHDGFVGYGPDSVTLILDTSFIANGWFEYSAYYIYRENDMTESDVCLQVYNGKVLTDEMYVPKELTERGWVTVDITSNGITLR